MSMSRTVSLQVNDTIKVDLETGKPIDTIKFEIGNVCMIARGRNAGRVGIMQHIERLVLSASCSSPCKGIQVIFLNVFVHTTSSGTLWSMVLFQLPREALESLRQP